MRVSDKGIVLQSIKRGDNKFILKLYTRQHGLLTVAATTGRSPGSKVKPACLLPLTFIDAELTVKQNKEIQQLTEASPYLDNSGISGSISKLAIAQFINELLIKSLKEQQPNHHLFEFIETCLAYLSGAEDSHVNLHLYFLSELCKYLGFEPHNNYSSTCPYFDCRNGGFSPVGLAFPLGLDAEDSVLLSEFLKINSLKIKISNGQRRRLLDILLAYYRLHVPGFNDMKSLEVLRELMSI